MGKLFHKDLLKLGQVIGYKLTDAGLCRGFSAMWAQAVLEEDEISFYERMEFIASYKSPGIGSAALKADIEEAEDYFRSGRSANEFDKNKDEKFRKLLQIRAFYEGVTLYLIPTDHRKIFNNQYVSQDDLSIIYPLVKSQKQEEEKTDISILLNTVHAFDKASLTSYLSDLANELKKTDLSLPIMIGSAKHSVCLKYDKHKDVWHYVDTNDFFRFKNNPLYYRELNTEELANSLFESLTSVSIEPGVASSKSDHLIFNTTILAKKSTVTPALEDSFAAFNLKGDNRLLMLKEAPNILDIDLNTIGIYIDDFQTENPTYIF